MSQSSHIAEMIVIEIEDGISPLIKAINTDPDWTPSAENEEIVDVWIDVMISDLVDILNTDTLENDSHFLDLSFRIKDRITGLFSERIASAFSETVIRMGHYLREQFRYYKVYQAGVFGYYYCSRIARTGIILRRW